MGIKHFFFWFKKQFSKNIIKISNGQTCENISIDNFMIDMNGIFHNSAQKIYKYGNCKPPQRLLKNGMFQRPIYQTKRNQLLLFQDVCERVEYLFNVVKPKKRFILCIDGTAPLSKQNQQRQRRFRASKEGGESKENTFDPNSITPGTKFMDYLSKYIDFFLHTKIAEDERWKNIEIIFSNEKVPGEGEMKCINYIRNYGNPDESYCITALDADLIMLTLGTHMPNIYVLREDLYDPNNEFLCVDIGAVRRELSNILYWEQYENNDGDNESKSSFSNVSVINDFFFLCFSVGNDFLPHIPSIEIIENGIELIIEVYREVCSEYGHITYDDNGKIKFNPIALGAFFQAIGQYEKENFENKLLKKNNFFPDTLLESCSVKEESGWNVDIERYKSVYYQNNFPENTSIEKISHSYLEGMQWVLSYYTDGVPNWKWFYPYHYAPHSSTLADHIKTFEFPNYGPSNPTTPFQQLLCVLPPKSSILIPPPLSNLLTDESSPLKDFYPNDFEVDLAGKRKEWEGTVILPMVNFSNIQREYFNYISRVNQIELKRNIKGKSFIYKYNDTYSKFYRSYYGNIENCHIELVEIEL